jgi:hypothetical protein
MGLWLQCPGCQTKNPLSLRVCPVCGRSLDNLPPELRVYVIGPAEAPAPAPETPAVAPEAGVPETTATEAAAEPEAAGEPEAAPAPEAPKAVKKPKKTRKKKG